MELNPPRQNWTRLVRFLAVETGRVHLGQPIERNVDGQSFFIYFNHCDGSLMIIRSWARASVQEACASP